MTDLMNELRKVGYFHLHATSYEHFVSLCSGLGEIIDVTNVRHDDNSSSLLASREKMGFHTDHPSADVVAWWCKTSAIEGGETVLSDAWKAIESMADTEVALLRSIDVRVPHINSVNEGDKTRPALIGSKDIYIAKWLMTPTREVQHAIDIFLWDALKKSIVFKRKIEAGESVFLNNKRILHARSAFSDSCPKRELIRVWVRLV